MDRMEEAARNGTREEAEAMLDQMQEMFENMRSAEEDEESPAEQEMRKQMDELGKLLRDQQALRDETFRSDQRDRERKRAQGRARPPEQDEQAQPDDNGPSTDLDQGETDSKPDEGEANPDGPQLEQRQRDAARPPGRIAAHAEEPWHEGREGIRRRGKGHEGGRGRP